MFTDNTSSIQSKFFSIRNKDLNEKFDGHYRSLVVETNDPLNMYRVRFKCPELHDWNLKPEQCPWAVVNSQLGGRRAGSWHHPMIDDWVWITFEKNHPYGPIVTGFCNPTRRKLYTYWSIHTKTPLPVDQNGETADQPDDYLEEYLPKDGRPMSTGWQDRYGNLDISSAVGYFPTEHAKKTPDPDYDALQMSMFDQSKSEPEVNGPDCKYMLRLSKYGNGLFLGDQGYWWKKDSESSDYGEFEGDFVKDEQFEINRFKYLTRLFNEDKPSDHDQRRIMLLDRYGSKFEMRSVGWAQDGPIQSKTREGEYGEPRIISKESEADYRWLKLRSKGGWLFQAYDKGFHPQDDLFIKRKLIDEVGTLTEKEDEHWKDKDARWFRMVGRHGYKFVIDERGSSDTDAEGKETPRGNGILIKGRRTGSSQSIVKEGDPRGFFWEFNENEDTNQTTWGSPLGNVIQINDRHQYMLMSSRRKEYPMKWQKLKENEFLLESLVSGDHEKKSHHLKLDLHNEYVSFKTRVGYGDGPDGPIVNPVAISDAMNQGIEARDGARGDGPWVEVVDSGERNLWLWNKGYVICHARRRPDPVNLMWWFDENKKELVIKHNETTGKLQIMSNAPIEIISNSNINVYAKKQLTIRSDERIILTSQGTGLEIGPYGVLSNKKIEAPEIDVPRTPNISPLPIPVESMAPRLVPNDRGKRYNDVLDAPADKDEIEHPIKGTSS